MAGIGTWIRNVRQTWLDYPLREGKTIAERYRIERFLGMGSYGQAYAARDSGGRQVMLKLNKPSKGRFGIHLLRREDEIMCRLLLPGIPQRLDYFRCGRREALVTELVQGNDLERLIMDKGEVFGQREALVVLRQLMQTLSGLHEAGYVHRDVRLPNVMMGAAGITLIDFGLACPIGEERADDPAAKQDKPEDAGGSLKQRMRRPYPASDLHGSGHLLLFLLYSGYKPPEDAPSRSWEEELELFPEIARVIRKLLTEDESGYRSAAECAVELDRLLEELPPDQAAGSDNYVLSSVMTSSS
ncbi:serine/threonine protein kinase [Paenibacillus beijingensis]|uniref:Protein kinase domain-containing protein n=1 Tax=Paenibacillus beijingensis TaxID=1126833 RepID=A0A0D5NGE9_9BACL|nr:protein kinase [Paenibacillus beijingensis]AJY74469.1 hypothetical protein VN24_07650 [Paenibacillus beijingensis]